MNKLLLLLFRIFSYQDIFKTCKASSINYVCFFVIFSTLDINVKALINTTRLIAKNFLQHKTPGVIVNLSSSISNLSAYIAAKGAVDAYTRACALELGPHNIRINCVNATIILTETDELGYEDPSMATPLYEITPLKR